VTTGVVSIAGNLAMTGILVGAAGLNFMAANAIAIGACSLFNFVVSDRYVFEK
jgi:putative flippase GtrA